MTAELCCSRDATLDSLLGAIERHTNNRLSTLSVHRVDGAVAVHATSCDYHAVQLVLSAVGNFADCTPLLAPVRLRFQVNDRLLFLVRQPDTHAAKPSDARLASLKM